MFPVEMCMLQSIVSMILSLGGVYKHSLLHFPPSNLGWNRNVMEIINHKLYTFQIHQMAQHRGHHQSHDAHQVKNVQNEPIL